MTEALALAKLATGLQRRIDHIYSERCIGDDVSSQILDEILKSFESVGELVEERLKAQQPEKPKLIRMTDEGKGN